MKAQLEKIQTTFSRNLFLCQNKLFVICLDTLYENFSVDNLNSVSHHQQTYYLAWWKDPQKWARFCLVSTRPLVMNKSLEKVQLHAFLDSFFSLTFCVYSFLLYGKHCTSFQCMWLYYNPHEGTNYWLIVKMNSCTKLRSSKRFNYVSWVFLQKKGRY
jgi:hypothetical protein